MRRKYFLFVFSLFFIAGNIVTSIASDAADFGRPFYTILIMCDMIIITLSLLMRKRFYLLWTVTAFCLGQSGFCTAELLCKNASIFFPSEGVMRIRGLVEDLGVSSSGKRFARISMGCENTVLYALPPNIQPLVGDSISANVRASRVSDFSEGFNYRAHMARQGIFYTCIPIRGETITILPSKHIPAKLLPAALRQRFSRNIDNIFPNEEDREARSVIKALCYGYQDEVPQEIMEDFRNSGAMHLLALSGMHLVLIYSILSMILSIIGNSPAARKIRAVALLILLWAYTVFTGCGVSILRAMVMISIYEVGSLCGRSKHHLNSLALSAIIIAITNPYAPGGLSFMLSYAAMTAIFLIHPMLSEIITPQSKTLRRLTDACSISVSCQLLTAPIIFLHFGTFAHFSLLVNIICSPITSAAMMLTPAALITASIPHLGFISEGLVALMDLLIYINRIIGAI